MDVIVEDKEQKKGKAPADAEGGEEEEEEVEVVSSLQGTSRGQNREHYARGER